MHVRRCVPARIEKVISISLYHSQDYYFEATSQQLAAILLSPPPTALESQELDAIWAFNVGAEI